MIKISEAGSMAIHSMALLAGLGKDEKISTVNIAKTFGISKNHLSKVMQSLVKAGLVESDRGPGGGFKLAIAPEKISLLDIYMVTEGGFSMKKCLLNKKFCFGKDCVLGGLLSKINEEIYGYLTKTRLLDIAIRRGDKK